MDSLESRIALLEKSARRWRLCTAALLILGIGAVSLGQITLGGGTGGMRAPLVSADQIVVSKSITLNDSNARGRLVLSVENDIPAIRLKDKNEKTLVIISADPNTQAILVQDATGKKLFGAP